MKDKRVDIKYVSLPTDKLPPDYLTYSVSVYGHNLYAAGLSAESVGSVISMNGFKRVEGDEFGHLRISINTGSTTCGRPAFKSKTTTTKNDKGVETKTTTYWYEMTCSSGTSYKISDPESSVLASGSNSHSNTLKTSEFSSSSSMNNQYESLISGLRSGFEKDVAMSAARIAQAVLVKKYDFAYTRDDPQFYFIKKHPAEDEFEANLEKTIDIFKNMSAATPSSEGLEKMEPIIAFWKKYGEKDPGADKDLMDVYIACNSNLANTYYYLDQFDEAERYATRVLKVDQKDKRTSRLLEQMAKTRELMNFHDIHTMHYSRDLTSALPPSKVKAIEEEKEEIKEENNSLAGLLILKGDSLKGFFVRSKDQSEFMFGPNGNTKFILDTPNAIKEHDITSPEVSEFSIGDRNFKKINFSPSAKGKTEPSLQILEELYNSDKIKLYKYYPVSGVLSNEQYEFAFQKPGDLNPISLMDTKFLLWEKGLAAYFSDCEDLKAMCLSGSFKMEEDDLLKAARIYSEVCQ
jgi:tetratricopeptide (TPR) repeat protein